MNQTSQSHKPFRTSSKANLIHHLGGNPNTKTRFSKKSSNSVEQNKFSATNPLVFLHAAMHNKQAQSKMIPQNDKFLSIIRKFSQIKKQVDTVEIKQNEGISQLKLNETNKQQLLVSSQPTTIQVQRIQIAQKQQDNIQINSSLLEKKEKEQVSAEVLNPCSQSQNQQIKQTLLQTDKNCHFKDCEMITSTLMRALKRLQQLQVQHKQLLSTIQKQRKSRQTIQLENKTLKQNALLEKVKPSSADKSNILYESKIQSMQIIKLEIEKLKDKLNQSVISQSRATQQNKSFEDQPSKIMNSRLLNSVYL